MSRSVRNPYRKRPLVLCAMLACVLLSAALFAGCQAEAPAVPANDAATTSPPEMPATDATVAPPTLDTDMQATAPTAASAIDAQLRKGMAYGDFRKAVLAAGWEPLPSPDCRANLLGDAAERTCAADPQMIQCRICGEMPELDSCSSDALCLVRFRNMQDGRVMKATGRGELRYWQDAGEDAGLQVVDWEYAAAK